MSWFSPYTRLERQCSQEQLWPPVCRYLAKRKNNPKSGNWKDRRFVVLDTETSGLNPQQDKLLSIGAVAVKGRDIILGDSLHLLLRQSSLSNGAVSIHGIRPADSKSGLPPKEALGTWLDFLGDSILVAHHLAFDQAILKRYIRGYVPGFRFYNRSLDTAYLARKLAHPHLSPDYIKSNAYSLDKLMEDYHLAGHGRHTALGDARITAELLLKLLYRWDPKGKRRLPS